MDSQNHKKEAKRKKALGELGELFAIKALVDNNFNNIKNLNDYKRNYAFADIYAEKDNHKYVISVKARNQMQKNGKENTSYKLGKNVYINAQKAADAYDANPYWMAIPFDKNTFSIYFGSLNELGGKLNISITKCKNGEIGSLFNNFPKAKHHYFDWSFFENEKTLK